jgi:peptidoglycan/LPS O-acetylase OafA/YrhL
VSERRLSYLPALDGLRGVAILLVVGYHYFGLPLGGNQGVDLFFVLSGFLITTLLLEEREAGRISLRCFYTRRARRLFPALAVLLAAFLLLGGGLKLAAAGGLYTGNVMLAFGWFPGLRSAPIGPLWSLAQEEQFYLVWPLIIIVLGRRRLPLIFGALLILLAGYRIGVYFSGASFDRIYYGADLHSDGLVAGALLAALRHRRRSFAVPEWVGQLGGAVLLGAVIVRLDTAEWQTFSLPIVDLACVALVAAAVSQTEMARTLSTRWLVWTGTISYSLYLWHDLVRSEIHERALAIAVSFFVAWLSYRFVEQPFRRRRSAGLERADSLSPAKAAA